MPSAFAFSSFRASLRRFKNSLSYWGSWKDITSRMAFVQAFARRPLDGRDEFLRLQTITAIQKSVVHRGCTRRSVSSIVFSAASSLSALLIENREEHSLHQVLLTKFKEPSTSSTSD